MTTYEDAVVRLDDAGVTIKSFHRPGRARTIAYGDISSVEVIALALFTGRHRLVGISPGRPTTYFHWDPNRRHKRRGLRLDIGGFLKRAITPDDPDLVHALVEDEITKVRRPG